VAFFDRFKNKVGKPEDPNAILQHADSCLEKGDLRAAIAAYDHVLTLLTVPADRFRACYNRALAHQRSGDFIAAIPSYDQAAQLFPTFARVYLERGIAKAISGSGVSGMSDFDKAIALLSDDMDRAMAYGNRGNAYLEQGERQLALADFTRAIAIAPQFTPAQEAKDKLERELRSAGAELGPGRGEELAAGRLQSGWECRYAGDMVGALAHFHRVVELSPDDRDALYARAVANSMLRRHSQAISDLDQALALRPRFPAALCERGLTYREAGQPEKALADFDAALALDPAFDHALNNKGLALLDIGRHAEALECLDLAVRLNPREAEYYAGRGYAFECLGNAPRACEDFERCLELSPEGRKTTAARDGLARLKASASPLTAAPALQQSPAEKYALKHVEVDGRETVAAAVTRIQAARAYFAVRRYPKGQFAGVSVYGAHGLRDRLTEIADAIGPAVLDLALEEIADLWFPVSPQEAEPEPSGASNDSRTSDTGRVSLLTHGDEVLCVIQHERDSYYPELPTALFGPTPAFEREGKPVGADGARVCLSCGAQFAYYRPVLHDALLVDYACPECSASPLVEWIEARMRRGRYSQGGFLGPSEHLACVIERDEKVLDELGITAAQLAAALDHLLQAAITQQADRINRASVTLSDDLVRRQARGFAGLAVVPLPYTLEEVESQLRAGRLPPAGQGSCILDHQVFLRVYHGYQHCPWTILERPWSRRQPGMQVRVEQRGDRAVATPVLWQTMPCRPPTGYRYGECDFLLLDRQTGAYVKGPGMMVHLIGEHHFFEGEESPYRVDPMQLAKVLRLA
jgi:tetratricopeptide (TPR) repeat protein